MTSLISTAVLGSGKRFTDAELALSDGTGVSGVTNGVLSSDWLLFGYSCARFNTDSGSSGYLTPRPVAGEASEISK